MSWLGRIAAASNALFARASAPVTPAPRLGDITQALAEVIQRGWNGTSDNRITEGHWGSATSSSINLDLVTDLPELRQRSRFERMNNGILHGMAMSNAMDVVGPHGPTLQVLTDDKAYRQQLESLWCDFWACPDINGQLSGVDFLIQDIVSEWDNGESIKLKVNDPDADGVQLRLQAVAPRRVETPIGANATDLHQITLGVRRNFTGKPLSYFVREDADSEFAFGIGLAYSEIPASNVIHDFMSQEPGQVRGVPLLALFFYSEDASAKPVPAVGAIDLEPGQALTCPPGYKPSQVNPAQPGQKYNDFRDAKLGEIGRPAGMPLMSVKLDSAGHSYSSARFDGQSYQRSVEFRQRRAERITMRPVFSDFHREAMLVGLIGPPPSDLRTAWVWAKRPHVDPGKEADAIHTRLEDGSIDQGTACAEYGLDLDQVRAARKAQGLPEGPTWIGPDAVKPKASVGRPAAPAGKDDA